MMNQLNINKMKNICYFLICILLLYSCGNGKKKAAEKQQAYYDSIAKVMKLQEIEKNRVKDSLAVFAWGDAKFGISMSEALKTDAFKGFKKDNYNNRITKSYGYDALFHEVIALFNHDKLYRVVLESDMISYEKYNTKVPEISEKYKTLISEKYGCPDVSYPIPNPYTIEKGVYYFIYNWDVNNKQIYIAVSNSHILTDRYVIKCIIIDQAEQKLQEQEEKTKEQEEKDRRRKQEKEQSLF